MLLKNCEKLVKVDGKIDKKTFTNDVPTAITSFKINSAAEHALNALIMQKNWFINKLQ